MRRSVAYPDSGWRQCGAQFRQPFLHYNAGRRCHLGWQLTSIYLITTTRRDLTGRIRIKAKRASLLLVVSVLAVVACVVVPGRNAEAQVPAATSVNLFVGANLVVYNGAAGPVDLALADVASDVSTVWRFEAPTQAWQLWTALLPPALRGFSTLESGRPYFIIARQAVTWTFPEAIIAGELPVGSTVDVAGLSLSAVRSLGPITTAGLTQAVTDILDGAALPILADGVWGGTTSVAQAQADGLVTATEVSTFRNTPASLIAAGQNLTEFTWTAADGSTFTTLGTMTAGGSVVFEPITFLLPEPEEAAAAGLQTAQVSGSDRTSRSGVKHNKLGMDATTWTFDATIFTQMTQTNMFTHYAIVSQVENINFSTLFLWEAKATKNITRFTINRDQYTTVECKTIQIAIVYATGFKEVSGSVAADGFSASLTVKGNIGSNGQIQFAVTLCADGNPPP